MKKLAVGIAVSAGVAILMIAATTYATPSKDFTTDVRSQGRFGEIDVKNETDNHELELKTKGESDVWVVENTVQPGGHSGWHSHPGPSLVTVKSGTATFYDGDDPDCTPHVVQAGGMIGTGVIDTGDVHILRNEGTVPLVTVAVQIIPAGTPRRIDEPDPGNCHF
jgi:quercetin dioxygenase-like cupin family protein